MRKLITCFLGILLFLSMNCKIIEAKEIEDTFNNINIQIIEDKNSKSAKRFEVKLINNLNKDITNVDVNIEFPDELTLIKGDINIKSDVLYANDNIKSLYIVEKTMNKTIIFIIAGVMILIGSMGLIFIGIKYRKGYNILALIIIFTFIYNGFNVANVKAETKNICESFKESINVDGKDYKFKISISYDELNEEDYQLNDEDKNKLGVLIKGIYCMNMHDSNFIPIEYLDTTSENGIPSNDISAACLIYSIAGDSLNILNKNETDCLHGFTHNEYKEVLKNSIGYELKSDPVETDYWKVNEYGIYFRIGNFDDVVSQININECKKVDENRVFIKGNVDISSLDGVYLSHEFEVYGTINSNSPFGGITVNKFRVIDQNS